MRFGVRQVLNARIPGCVVWIHQPDPVAGGRAPWPWACLHAQFPDLLDADGVRRAKAYLEEVPPDISKVYEQWIHQHCRWDGYVHMVAGINCHDVAWAQRRPHGGDCARRNFIGTVQVAGWTYQLATGRCAPTGLEIRSPH